MPELPRGEKKTGSLCYRLRADFSGGTEMEIVVIKPVLDEQASIRATPEKALTYFSAGLPRAIIPFNATQIIATI
jgi:hypothetical protein